MRLKYFCFCLLIGTAFSLGYTWQQVEIIKLAYQGGRANKAYKELLDKNHYLRYNLLNLKSASYLGNKLLDENTLYEIPAPSQVLSLALPKDTAGNHPYAFAELSPAHAKDTLFLSALKIQDAWPLSLVSVYLNKQAQAQDLGNNQ